MLKHIQLRKTFHTAHHTTGSEHTPQIHPLDSTMVYKHRILLSSMAMCGVRVYQAPPGNGLSKQLAPSGD